MKAHWPFGKISVSQCTLRPVPGALALAQSILSFWLALGLALILCPFTPHIPPQADRIASVQCFELTPCLTTQLGDRLTPWIEPGSNSAAPGGAGCATGAGRAGRRAGGMITSGPHRLGRSRPTPSPDWSTAMRDGHGDARRAVSLRPLACRPRGALPRYGSQLRRAPGWGPCIDWPCVTLSKLQSFEKPGPLAAARASPATVTSGTLTVGPCIDWP